ncbi:MAG: hypothetical protein OEV87_12890, partial [Phycisphaerae bacterium]|nr:hypothetical protein [Phycisphaerae bacterium]
LTLSSLADGIIMVVESSKTPIKDVQDALGLMPKEKFMGFVLNKHISEKNGYYNYYARAAKDRAKA